MAGFQVASNVWVQRPGGQRHRPGILYVFGLDQDAHDHLEKLRPFRGRPRADGSITVLAFHQEGLPLTVAQPAFEATQVGAVDVAQEVTLGESAQPTVNSDLILPQDR